MSRTLTGKEGAGYGECTTPAIASTYRRVRQPNGDCVELNRQQIKQVNELMNST